MNTEPLRLLIVDDSRIFRGAIEEALLGVTEVKVVGSVWSGEKALELARQSLPDFVTLDIHMPGLGGLETLKALRALASAQRKPIGVLLVSAHTKRGAAVTIEGLQEGAFDFITKPDGPDPQANAASLRTQLLERLNAFRSSRAVRVQPLARVTAGPNVPTPPPEPNNRRTESDTSSRRVATRRGTRFRAVVIGASTGGPEALTRLLPAVAPRCPVPIFLVQHMPVDFTEYFAAGLARRCGSTVVEAQEGMTAEPRRLYVAPGGKHLVLHHRGERVYLGLSDAPPENGCRPAADVLFRSAATAYAGNILAVVLTGMGTDGAKGAIVLKRAGAHIIVQDEASSVVWGMPGSTVAAGAADQVLPLDEMGTALRGHLGMES